ncbi:MAG: glycosyl transferase [Candidatus Cloacimonetes bacterium 4572_55]|nr:MAG: glycosyl transferase [Candidatus Cloacimonetes bacterium 4572_55]
MRVMFMNSIGSNKFGGGEKWMIVAARGLADAGRGKAGSKLLATGQSRGVETQPFNIRADISPITTIRIARFLRKERIDVLICNLNKDVRVAGLAARIVSRRAGTCKLPVTLARHGILLCSKKQKHKLTLTLLTNGIITNSETIKESYRQYGWFDEDFVRVIYNGVENKDSVAPYDFGERFPGKKVIFSAGRLADQKGFDLLIEAAAILKNQWKTSASDEANNLIFAIAGQGRREGFLKELSKKRGVSEESSHFPRVIFLGHLEDIAPYLKGCDLFVLASRFEGMPNAVMEAMATGKPVIATDVNGARELVTHGETGEIIPPENPQALAQAIRNLIHDPDRLRSYGRAARQRVRERFTIPGMIRELESYLLEMTRTR